MALFPRMFVTDYPSHLGDTWRLLHVPVQSMRRFEQEMDSMLKNVRGDHMLELEDPFVTDKDGNRKLQLKFDVNVYKPEEVTVKTVDNKLVVHAKHVEEGPGRRNHSEFTRVVGLPDDMDLKQLKSTLTKDGILQIEGPAPPAIEPPKENMIPIEHLRQTRSARFISIRDSTQKEFVYQDDAIDKDNA